MPDFVQLNKHVLEIKYYEPSSRDKYQRESGQPNSLAAELVLHSELHALIVSYHPQEGGSWQLESQHKYPLRLASITSLLAPGWKRNKRSILV